MREGVREDKEKKRKKNFVISIVYIKRLLRIVIILKF